MYFFKIKGKLFIFLLYNDRLIFIILRALFYFIFISCNTILFRLDYLIL